MPSLCQPSEEDNQAGEDNQGCNVREQEKADPCGLGALGSPLAAPAQDVGLVCRVHGQAGLWGAGDKLCSGITGAVTWDAGLWAGPAASSGLWQFSVSQLKHFPLIAQLTYVHF